MLYATLDQYDFAQGDYGRTVTFHIYQEDKSTAFNLTGYAVTVRIMDRYMQQTLQNITATVTSAATGTGNFVTSQLNTWNDSDYFFVELELTKTGEVTSCIPIRVYVYASPYP